jgi:quinol monooxygenase YgiN
MIHVIATIRVVPNRRTEFLAEFGRILADVRAEAGCIEYGPTLEVNTGIAGVPEARQDVVIVVEKWESVSALDAHLKSPHMFRYREKVKDLVTEVEIRVASPA